MLGQKQLNSLVMNQLFSAGALLVLTACGNQPNAEQSTPTLTVEQSQAPDKIATQPQPNSATIPVPAIPPGGADQRPQLPLSSLIPATSPDERAGQVKPRISQRDPFASTTPAILLITTNKGSSQPEKTSTASIKSAKSAKQNAVKSNQAQRNSRSRNLAKDQTTQLQKQAAPVKVAKLNSLRTIQPKIAPRQAIVKSRANVVAGLPKSIPSLPSLATTKPASRAKPTSVARSTKSAAKAPVKPATPTTVQAKPIPKPQPTLAAAVNIMGIVQTNGRTMVIAQAPNESAARYVAAGGVLSGGKVRIKSVQIRPGSEPIVILEENGIEVSKSVGGR